MPFVRIRSYESFEGALRRFKRTCEKAGVMSRLRELEAYEKPTTKRKRKQAAAVKREQKRQEKQNEIFAKVTRTKKSKSKDV